MDIYKGYRYLFLQQKMRDWFIFRYDGRYFQCIVLPFGWGLSLLWFTRLKVPFVVELQSCGYRV